MRKNMSMLPLLALAACSQSEPSEQVRQDPTIAADVAQEASSTATRAAPGGIGITAAPGVAFFYRYAFSLPAERVATAQEAHAQACEKLGIARCRITGMRYRLIGENDVEAMLAFKLDPAIARGFGKTGIGVVEAAEGTLVDAEITGTDAGAAIDRLTTDRARGTEELQRIDRELARPGLRAPERVELQRQRAEIARQLAAVDSSTSEQRESLANTPMVFDYRSGRAIRGFDASSPLTSAIDTAIASLQTTLAVLLGVIALLGPPALLLALLWFGWRSLRRRWPPRAAGSQVETPPPA